MNIGIIGAGSVGLLIASLLHDSHKVTVFTKRNEQKHQLNHNGIHMHEEKSIYISSIHAKTIADLTKQDLYIICVKQPQLEKLLCHEVWHTVHSYTPILCVQNGMSHIEQLQSRERPTYIGVFEHGVRRTSDYEIEYNGKGLLRVSRLSGDEAEYQRMMKEIDNDRFPIELEHDMMEMLLQKLAVNAIINSLTTLFMVPNGQIIENPNIKRMALMLTEEIATVLGFEQPALWNKVTRIAWQTKTNESSMLQDYKNGNETEIESILGYVLKYNNQSKPYTMFLYEAIKARIKEREFKNET